MDSDKWTRGLSKSTISNVLSQSPDQVNFKVDRLRQTVTCEIICEKDRAYGLAICSCLDRFDSTIGKNIAARRAVLALTEKHNSRPIRSRWDSFPDTWTKKRITHLQSFNGASKCKYVHQGGTTFGYMEPFSMYPLYA